MRKRFFPELAAALARQLIAQTKSNARAVHIGVRVGVARGCCY